MISRDLKIFPFKTKFRLIKGAFKTGFTVHCVVEVGNFFTSKQMIHLGLEFDVY
jgi:hypothetical protein